MTNDNLIRDRRILGRYADQPDRLPLALRAEIERSWGGQPVQLYALTDLDASMRLSETWVVLGSRHVAVATKTTVGWDLQSVGLDQVVEVRHDPGLSCHTTTVLGSADRPPLAQVRYTHRQRRAVELLCYVLEERLLGQKRPVGDPDAIYADRVASPVREAQALVAGSEVAVIWRLLGYLRPYRGRVALGMAAAALITLLSLVPPYLAGFLIDRVVRPVQAGTLSIGDARDIAWIAIGAMAVVVIVRQMAGWVRLRIMSVLGEYVARDLRTELYEHLQRLSLSFYSRKKTGSLITRVSADTDRLWEFLALGVVDVSLSIVMLVGLSAVLITLDWRLGLIMTVPLPAVCALIFFHGQRMNRLFARAWRKWSQVNDVLSDTIPGMRVVKAFNQEEREKERFGARNAAATSVFTRIHVEWTTFWPVLMLGVHGLTVVVWVFALPRLLGGTGVSVGLTAGTFVSFLLYMTMYVGPIDVIGQMARIINRATSSAHRIFDVLDTEPEVVDTLTPKRLSPVAGRVSFASVTFAYDGIRQVLRGVNLDVAPGEMIGLVGPSGGGKTTIANLIARFYDPTGGSVCVDGHDLRTLDTGHYRRQIGMVLQDPHLFHGTVLENIRYGVPESSTERVVEAAQAANAHDFICRLDHGYDTMVGERGSNLSGGERQRISIARAILCNPRILILDEATSSVDTETEAKIQEAMDRLVTGRTVFAIAHRLSTLRRADRLFVVKGGRITETGTHAELLNNPRSLYRTLYEKQLQVQYAV